MTVACLTTAQAAISVGAGGSAVYDFATTPPASEFATHVYIGDGARFTTAAGVATAVSTTSVASITRVLLTSSTIPPSTSSQGFRHNQNATTGLFIQSRPTTDGTNAANALLATLQNDTGSAQSAITVTYSFNSFSINTADEIRGFQVFYSLDGTPGSWQPIGALSDNITIGTQAAAVNVGSWASGSTMYLLWVDDNSGSGGTDESYTIDNFQVTPGGTITEGVTITSPTNTAQFAQGTAITINANALMTGIILDVSFYTDGVLIGSDLVAPYSAVYSNATLGGHVLTAVATDATHSITSAPVNITVNPNNPPTVTVTNPFVQGFLVGNNITNGAVAVDSDGTIARVEFYLDGVSNHTDTTSTYKYEYDDALVGTHTVTAVAVDNVGARGTNSVTFTITNPPNVTFLLTNGSTWKYLDDTNDPRLAGAWTSLSFNDSAWSNGVAEIGFGDVAQDRPEVTQVRRIIGSYTNLTFYFRKIINVANPAAFSGLVLNIKQDDGSIIYINGAEVYRSPNMPPGPVDHGTNTNGTLPDDGAGYYSSNLLSSVLVAGPNIIAVEMHQDAYASSDISFDMMLWGIAPAGPTLTVRYVSSTQVEVSWPIDASGALLYFKNTLNDSNWTQETGGVDVPSGGFHHLTISSTTPATKFWTLRIP